jgi:hypothetical protein
MCSRALWHDKQLDLSANMINCYVHEAASPGVLLLSHLLPVAAAAAAYCCCCCCVQSVSAEAYDVLHVLGGLSNDEIAAVFAEWNQGELQVGAAEAPCKFGLGAQLSVAMHASCHMQRMWLVILAFVSDV